MSLTMEELLRCEVATLKAELATVKRERNAALYDMHQLQGAICAYCKNLYRPDGADHCECKEFGDLSKLTGDDACSPYICGKFKWRGLCKENGGKTDET